MSLSIGIVGLPNVGKSTLFNALTDNRVLAANYPFATIEPNVGVVAVPDPRLNALSALYDGAPVVPATVTFVDIAGIVRGASKGEGLGNQFLAAIRECDAVCEVVRAFHDDDVVHVDARVDPSGDVETVDTELVLADLQTVENRLPRLVKEAKATPALKPVLAAVAEAERILGEGRTISAATKAGEVDAALLRDLHLLTSKPFIYVFNVDEDDLGDSARASELARSVAPAASVVVCAQIESELAGLDRAEAKELLASYGQEQSGLEQLVRVGFETLGLQTFLTAGPQGSPSVDHPRRRHRAEGGRRHPHRLRAGLHQGGGDQLRRPRGGRLGRGGPHRRQGPHRGQGLCHARRRRGGVSVQHLSQAAESSG